MRKFLYLCAIFLFVGAVQANDENVGPSYTTPTIRGDVYIQEPFDSEDAIDSWTHSKATKDDVDSEIAKYDGQWKVEGAQENALPGDTGLVLKGKARHHAISSALDRPFVFDDKPFIMQYEVNFQTGIECGGAYVKLLSNSEDLELESFHDKTPYTIMFGPDKCGEDYKLHFIFRHKNPKTGEFEEKHAKKPTVDIKNYYTDKATHLYTLMINPDNSFKVYIDQTEVNSGNLLADMEPPVNPPKEIEDKNDHRPADWDSRETIPDPEATKPDDWDEEAPAKITDPDAEMPEGWLEDEPLYVDDPEASKPDDWDDDMDGEWEAPKIDNIKCKEAPGCGTWEPPTIANPAYQGIWSAPQIPNPNYQGIWRARMIPNPDYFEDQEPFKMTAIGAVGFELWSMSEDIMFDDILITSDKQIADDYAAKTWKLKKAVKAENEELERIKQQQENEKLKKEKRKKKKRSRKRSSRKKHLRRNKPGFLQGLLAATEERPWLWIIYVLVVGLPIILIVTFCCSGKNKADPKKTDEPTPDDPHDEDEQKEQDGDDEGAESQREDEEGDASQEEASQGEEGSQGEEEEDAGSKGDSSGKPVTKADLEEDEEDDSGPVRRSPRKRKPRVQD